MSDWASPPVLVRKKDGGVCWCIDYRALNSVTVKDAFPLPCIEECLDTLAKAKYMSTLDLVSGYWQLEIDEADRHKTAFVTRYGLFEHVRLGFGLCNAPATFSLAMQAVLLCRQGLLWNYVLAYLDDVIVVGNDFETVHQLYINCTSTCIRSFEKGNVFPKGVGFSSSRHTLYSGHRCFRFSDWSRAAADTGREGETNSLRKLHPHSCTKKILYNQEGTFSNCSFHLSVPPLSPRKKVFRPH